MPVIRSAKKQMRQNAVRKARNYPVRTMLKTYVKKMDKIIKEGNATEAVALMPKVSSVIDMAAKKKIIHNNTAARKKSRLARNLNALQSKAA